MKQGGTLTVSSACGTLGRFLPSFGGAGSCLQKEDLVVVLRLRDSGPGIEEDHLARIFDPFFSTKKVGAGTGLGLSVVKKIIDLNRGLIDVRNAPEGGVVVTLAFAVPPSGSDSQSSDPLDTACMI
jgi:signal transduction histidine kinase